MARKKNRPVAEVNSGSMADIAFLLLIFFLVTTTIANNKGIMTFLPPKIDPNEPPPEVVMNERNIFKILANSQNDLLVESEPLADVTEIKEMVKKFVLNFGSPSEEDVAVYNSLPPTLKGYVNANGKLSNSSDGPGDAVVSFRADRGTNYDLYIQVLDEVNGAYNEIYAERVGITSDEWLVLTADRKNSEENAKYFRGKAGIPRAISIAEPTK